MEEIANIGEIVIFNDENGSVSVQIDAVNETVWLTQKAMAQLFGVDIRTVSYHLGGIFKSGELIEDSVLQRNWITASDGKNYLTKFYNLDAIISVGYRVNSTRATRFRQWATKTLRTYMVKGYLLDGKRFEQGQSLTYFKELLEKIRAIRVQERVLYQQVKEIYKLSADYKKDEDDTREFFAKVQNKFLFAVSGKTRAELVYYRANHKLPNMGLTSTENVDRVLMSDIGIGKNYLTKDELHTLELIVEQYLAFAEAQAINHIPMYKADWEKNLDIILTMNRKDILSSKGRISVEQALKKAREEYHAYKQLENEEIHEQSIKELDADLKFLNKHSK